MKIEFKYHPNGEIAEVPTYVEFRDDGSLFCNQFGDWVQEKSFSYCDGEIVDKEYNPNDWRNLPQSITIYLKDNKISISCGNAYSGSSNQTEIPKHLIESVNNWVNQHVKPFQPTN